MLKTVISKMHQAFVALPTFRNQRCWV